MLISVRLKKLTPSAAFIGGILSFCIYIESGYIGIIIMGTFFVIGVFVTSWKIEKKLKEGLAENNKGRRTAYQVIANAGVAAGVSVLSFICPQLKLNTPLLIAACFASATADTVSSELGNVYGRNFYHILSFKKSKKGANGIISLEGSVLGAIGSMFIALVYALKYGWDMNTGIIVLAGIIGNIGDSLLGATLEEKGTISNNMVNFFNTLFALLVALFLDRYFNN